VSLTVESEILSHLTQTRTAVVNQETIALGGHEVSIAMNIARLVQPRKHFVQESGDLLVRAASLELRDPDRAASSNFACLVDVGFEVVNVEGGVVPGKDPSVQLHWSIRCKKIEPPCKIERWGEQGTYQWMLMKSIVHPSQETKKLSSQGSPCCPFVTAGDPKYMLPLSPRCGSIYCFHAPTAASTLMQTPPQELIHVVSTGPISFCLNSWHL
jgi:hypothetical protein